MSKQTEALKLALEALEGLEALLLSMGLTHLIVYGDAEKAITNLQKELEDQPAQQTIHCKHMHENNGVCPHHNLQCGWPKCNEPEQPARPMDADHEFKNFHRALCERFGYTHDERDWKRDQVSLIEWIAKQAQPHQEPDRVKFERHWRKTRGEKKANRELPRHPLQPQTYIQDSANRHWVTWQVAVKSVSPPAQRNPLTHEQRVDLLAKFEAHKHEWHAPAILIDMVEAAHGITGEK